MLSTLEGIVLGAIQGLTEFLPISSSGHLVLVQQLFGMHHPALTFDVMLHLATLLATLWVFRAQVISLAKSSLQLPQLVKESLATGPGARERNPKTWLLLCILISTIITGGIGIAFHDFFEAQFSTMKDLWWQFAITGLTLFMVRRKGNEDSSSNERGEAQITIWHAVCIGLAQGIAIVPAISRSGITIAAALFLGFNRRLAGEYSFLVSIPTIAGAVILESRSDLTQLGVPLTGAVGGFVASLVLGALSLKLLLGWIRRGKLGYFAYYCFGMAILTLLMRSY